MKGSNRLLAELLIQLYPCIALLFCNFPMGIKSYDLVPPKVIIYHYQTKSLKVRRSSLAAPTQLTSQHQSPIFKLWVCSSLVLFSNESNCARPNSVVYSVKWCNRRHKHLRVTRIWIQMLYSFQHKSLEVSEVVSGTFVNIAFRWGYGHSCSPVQIELNKWNSKLERKKDR